LSPTCGRFQVEPGRVGGALLEFDSSPFGGIMPETLLTRLKVQGRVREPISREVGLLIFSPSLDCGAALFAWNATPIVEV
jgi:hypothetical protein